MTVWDQFATEPINNLSMWCDWYNITLDDENIYQVTRAARTRWKIEN